VLKVKKMTELQKNFIRRAIEALSFSVIEHREVFDE